MKINIKERRSIMVREVRTITCKEVVTIPCRRVMTINMVDVHNVGWMGENINVKRI